MDDVDELVVIPSRERFTVSEEPASAIPANHLARLEVPLPNRDISRFQCGSKPRFRLFEVSGPRPQTCFGALSLLAVSGDDQTGRGPHRDEQLQDEDASVWFDVRIGPMTRDGR